MDHQHFILHKPYGYLSQFINNQTKRRNKKLLGELGDFPKGTMAIGRLDENSEGLLLLTTCGKTSDYINSSKVEKEYYALVDGIIDQETIAQLSLGIDINIHGKLYKTKPCFVKTDVDIKKIPLASRKVRDERHGPTSWISITLREGKYRQIRKMTSKVGFPTLRLVRVRIGNINLTLKPSESLEVSNFKLENGQY